MAIVLSRNTLYLTYSTGDPPEGPTDPWVPRVVQRWTSEPTVAVGGDTLILGADVLKSADYTAGRVAVLLAYNRPLAPYELTRLYGVYGKRFGWPQPPGEGAVGGCPACFGFPVLLCVVEGPNAGWFRFPHLSWITSLPFHCRATGCAVCASPRAAPALQ